MKSPFFTLLLLCSLASADTITDPRLYWRNGRDVGSGPVRFTHAPMKVGDIGQIVPMGLMASAHVQPCDHQYWMPKDLKAGRFHYNVYAPADGFITLIQHRTTFLGDHGRLMGNAALLHDPDDYWLFIEHSGTFWSCFNLITQPDPAIEKAAGRRSISKSSTARSR